MAYSSITDLTRWIEEAELVALCTRDPEATLADPEVTAVASEAIQSADAEIDSFLLGRWPGLRTFDPAPDEINRLSANIAVYNLYLRRRAVSDHWRRSYEDCRGRLAEAASGSYSLGLDTAGAVAVSPSESFRTDTTPEERAYTTEKLRKL
jgi:phage gp36-like protein